ncbi:hypothetical protein HMPREF9161_00245 [Selenomonas sp. F0473]|nr:hypothetical protein HMPREF9161_00245 [Selenomonas sp. F0473]
MAAINDLIAQVEDEVLREPLREEVDQLIYHCCKGLQETF